MESVARISCTREEHYHPNLNMGDPTSRRNQTRNRLRAQLRKKRESLADQFDFKIYIAFVFKEKVCKQCLPFPPVHVPILHSKLLYVIRVAQICLCMVLLQKKKSALFEVAEVVPVMTNNYEENILRGVRDSSYSLESSIELLQKDVVQLHAPRYQSMRRVGDQGWQVFGVTVDVCAQHCFPFCCCRMW